MYGRTLKFSDGDKAAVLYDLSFVNYAAGAAADNFRIGELGKNNINKRHDRINIVDTGMNPDEIFLFRIKFIGFNQVYIMFFWWINKINTFQAMIPFVPVLFLQ